MRTHLYKINITGEKRLILEKLNTTLQNFGFNTYFSEEKFIATLKEITLTLDFQELPNSLNQITLNFISRKDSDILIMKNISLNVHKKLIESLDLNIKELDIQNELIFSHKKNKITINIIGLLIVLVLIIILVVY